MLTKLLQISVLGVAFGIVGCGSDDPSPLVPPGGGSGGSGPAQNGGSGGSGTAATGGNNAGGVVSGNGGNTATGGAATGGSGSGVGGNIPTGGAATGGKAATGGASAGGAATGGKAATGGASASGASAGGAATGGKAATGGAATAGATSTPACTVGTPLSGGTQHCSSNASGNVGSGYTWTIWSSGSGGCMTPFGVGAAFKANWNNSGDFLARVGLSLGNNKTYDQFGTLSADFAETHTGTAGGYSYIGIYGWSTGSAIHEYYIIDDWFGSRPNPGTKKGSITIDGEGTYDILTHMMTGPMITGGNGTFEQFWSLRTTARNCGHISITKHFDAWKALGMNLTNMYEAKILVEAGGGVGSIDFTTATITAQ